MSTTLTLDEAQVKLREVIAHLRKGDEISIVEGDHVVARIVGERSNTLPRPGPGLCQGMISIVADDDEHLKDFAEYMP
jgi:antitoxin (DNA-binding transcriptional repressor) of toxin-antitoxin stability system